MAGPYDQPKDTHESAMRQGGFRGSHVTLKTFSQKVFQGTLSRTAGTKGLKRPVVYLHPRPLPPRV